MQGALLAEPKTEGRSRLIRGLKRRQEEGSLMRRETE